MVTIEAETPWARIEEGIRQVPLLQERDGAVLYPYEDATITLQNFAYSAVRTTSLYVARNLLAVQRQIAEDIAPAGYDPLAMEGGLVLAGTNESGELTSTGFIPPIVEETAEEGAYLLDGSHRANLGRWAGRTTFRGIHITGIRPDCPAYAHPNDWTEVTIYDQTPQDRSSRKRYREGDVYALYRDFGALNGSTPRGS